MKHIFLAVTGILSGLTALLIFFPLGEGLTAMLFTSENVRFSFGAFGLSTDYPFPGSYGIMPVTLILFSPLIFSIGLSELSIILLGRIKTESFRAGLIVFLLVLIGHIIYLIFLGILSLIPMFNINSLWVEWIKYLESGSNEKLIITFGVIFIVFIYLNLVSARVKYLIPSVKSESAVKNKNGKVR